MHVLFVEPGFPLNQREFVRALHGVGARVTAIGESPPEALGRDVLSQLYGYERVPSVTNERALGEVVRRIQAREWVDRLESTVEAHTLPVTRVRVACGIPGTSERTAFLCRDKPAMKEALREVGVATAQSIGANSAEEVRSFAKEVGLPVILKPRDAAGAAGTYKASNDEELERAISACGVDRGMPTAVEEFVEGHEGFYDTISIEGKVVHEFISHYYPNVLEAMRERWITPQIVVTNQVDDARYDEVKALGKKVIETLGIGTSATHMEWFFGPKGLRFSEIGCRPPGVSVWDLYGAGNGLNVYDEWAKAIVQGRTEARCSREYATAMISLRPESDGEIVAYEGLDGIKQEFGQYILDHHFPPPGSGTAPIDGGYKANAWMRLRHPDFDALRAILDQIGERVTVRVR